MENKQLIELLNKEGDLTDKLNEICSKTEFPRQVRRALRARYYLNYEAPKNPGIFGKIWIRFNEYWAESESKVAKDVDRIYPEYFRLRQELSSINKAITQKIPIHY
jgi:hypothetical protein